MKHLILKILFLMKFIIPTSSFSRVGSLLIVVVYALVGMVVYMLFMMKIGAIKNIFGNIILHNKSIFNHSHCKI